MRKDKVIYSLNVGDIQEVAEDILERKLTEDELQKVCNRVGDYIKWDEAIMYPIGDEIKEEEEV